MNGFNNQETGRYYFSDDFREEQEMELAWGEDDEIYLRSLRCDICDCDIGPMEASFEFKDMQLCPQCYSKKIGRIKKGRIKKNGK